ncbi:MAG: PilZ domain-containing protein [Candidatus Omnitrophica bacterium]|nr:PilZ domain-containing protein [Candidatus Omnitrophota bacterium]
MTTITSDNEKRAFTRLNYASPLACKICKKETISRLLQGYTSNISAAGLLCNIRELVNPDDILWLCFDRGVLSICEELEKRVLIYQNGIIGKVIRVEPKGYNNFDVGIRFVTREEHNETRIIPEVNLIKQALKTDEK